MIYFLLAGNRVKIGSSKDPVSRIREIQVSCPYEIEVLFIAAGSFIKERELQMKFQNYRCINEWFDFGEGIRDYIALNEEHNLRYEYGFSEDDGFNGVHLRDIMKRRDIIHKELGKILGISQQAVNRMIIAEETTGRITIRSIKWIARALGYEYEYRFKESK